MADSSNVLLVLSGPTAVGKSKLTLHLAEIFEADIFSADSRQLYREMSVGTAKPSPEELQKISHHFIDHRSIHELYDVGRYEKEALSLLHDYFTKRKVAILSGGTGLYIKAVVDGLDEFPVVPEYILEEIKEEYARNGIEHLQSWLQRHDTAYYERVDINNPHRLIRAISIIRHTNRPFSSFLGHAKSERSFHPLFILLMREREELYQRINHRVDLMIEQGLIREAEALFPYRRLKSLQTVGYQELFDYLEGKHSLEKAIELIKRNTRRYAKRQLTWFRRDSRWHPFHPEEKEAIELFIRDQVINLST